MHDVGAGAQYLSTSEAGVAHVLEIDVTQCTDWFKDSPYTWGSPKGTDATMVDVGGKSVPYLVRKRSCQPPIVCSLMPAAVADRPHEVVNFEDPTWISAMNLCEADDSPERKVHKTTMVSLTCMHDHLCVLLCVSFTSDTILTAKFRCLFIDVLFGCCRHFSKLSRRSKRAGTP